MKSILLLALGLSCCPGCNDASAPHGPIAFTVSTDQHTYSLSTDQAATPLLVNRGTVPVYLPMNEYVAVQQFTSDGWSEPRPWFSVDGTSVSFSLPPGDTLRALPMAFKYVDNAPGVYRFLFEVAEDANGRHILAEDKRASPAFELRP